MALSAHADLRPYIHTYSVGTKSVPTLLFTD